MEKTNILTADLLDILFDGRNKKYGAYELRKSYDKRIRYSIGGTFLVCLLVLAGSLLAGDRKKTNIEPVIDVNLVNVQPTEEEKIEPPKEKPREQPPVETVNATPPKIVQDDQVKPDEEIAEVTKFDEAAIGTINMDGAKDPDVVAAPVEKETGIGKATLKEESDEHKIFITVQQEARYPGGMDAWRKFLERNLNRDTPGENGAPVGQYKVIVSFVVDQQGNLSDIKAENDPGYGTKEEAIKAILKSQQWIPALQNGRNVMYRQKQAITFSVNAD